MIIALLRLSVCAGGLLLAGACGDNTKACGEGTTEMDGLCIGQEVIPPTCSDGTILDQATNACVVDPTTCQGGTVLIRGTCEDPTGDVLADLVESVEPNGFGLAGEASAAPAGQFTLPASGSPGVVLHGRIAPQADRDADGVPELDIDTFVVDITAPAVIEVSVDGVGGMLGGVLVAGDAGLAGWSRIGLALAGDTARRRMYLPTPGRYRFGIADTRSLALGAAVGDDDDEYYVTIVQHPLTSPTPITLTAGMGTASSTLAATEVKFYTAQLGTGANDVVLATDADVMTASLVVSVAGMLEGIDDEDKPTSTPAALVVSGVTPADEVVLVVDHRLTTASVPVPFDLDVVAR